MRRPAMNVLTPTLLMLTASAGLVDSVSFLGLGRIFTANMTGNVLFLAFALAGAKGLSAGSSSLALGCFVVGALSGGRLAFVLRDAHRRWLVIAGAGETLLLLGATLTAIGLHRDAPFDERWPATTLVALAMGLRTATVRRLGVTDVRTTVVTSTLSGLASDLWLPGGLNPLELRRFGSVAALFAGALLGAVLVLHVGLAWPLSVAALAGAVATVVYWTSPEGPTPP